MLCFQEVIIDYSVAEPISFQVAAVESSHPIIEPRPRKPNTASLSGDEANSRSSNESEGRSTEEKADELKLRLSPEVEFKSTVFKRPKKKKSSTSSLRTLLTSWETRLNPGRENRAHRMMFYDFNDDDTNDNDPKHKLLEKSDTSSGDEKESDPRPPSRDPLLGLNLLPTVKLEDIARVSPRRDPSTRRRKGTRQPAHARWGSRPRESGNRA